MSFKDISYLELWRPFGLAEKAICVIFVRRHYQEQFGEIILYLDQWFRRRLKTFYLELWRPLYLAKRNNLCYFGRSHHEEQFCEIILNLKQWFRRCRLKDYSYLKLWRSFFQQSRTIGTILVKGIMRNNPRCIHTRKSGFLTQKV